MALPCPYQDPYPCGSCKVCRSKRVGEQVTQHQLELRLALAGLFVTLTYDDEFLPLSPSGYPTLRKKDLLAFIKALRRVGYAFRYRSSGEYGPKTARPHYHLLLYLKDAPVSVVVLQLDQVDADIRKAWGKGHIQVQSIEHGSELNASLTRRRRITYVAAHSMKTLRKDDPWYGDREPEFQGWTPGIGREAVEAITASLREIHAKKPLLDIPEVVRMDGRFQRLSYYRRQQIREALGLPLSAIERPPREPQEPPGQGAIGKARREDEQWQRKQAEKRRGLRQVDKARRKARAIAGRLLQAQADQK